MQVNVETGDVTLTRNEAFVLIMGVKALAEGPRDNANDGAATLVAGRLGPALKTAGYDKHIQTAAEDIAFNNGSFGCFME